MFIRIILFTLIGLLAVLPTQAQELEGRIDVVYERVQGVDPKLFQSLQEALNDFVFKRKWTDDNFGQQEKIQCNFLLTVLSKESGQNVFKANLTIQASRPVFNSSYNSPTVTYQDQEVVFRYDAGQQLLFNPNSVTGSDPLASNLTAVFAYYVYLIIGLDYDSFAPRGGSEYFKTAQNIVNNAPEEGKKIMGWKSSENNRNRYWLVEQLLNARFATFRTFWYNYHRKGLDVMAEDPEAALKTIFAGVDDLNKINSDNISPVLLQFYFNAKYPEWANFISQAPKKDRQTYANNLMKLDVAHADQYRNIK